MQTCTSLSSSDTCKSFTKSKTDSRCTARVRLVGGRFHQAIAFDSTMSSISCPFSLATADNKVSSRKRNGAHRKRNKSSLLTDVNANVLPACEASNNLYVQTDFPCMQSLTDNTTVALESLPSGNLTYERIAKGSSGVMKKQAGRRKSNSKASVSANANALPTCEMSSNLHVQTDFPCMQSLTDNTTLALESLPSGNLCCERIAEGSSGVMKKPTGRRKSNCKARVPAAKDSGRTVAQKSRGCKSVPGPGRNTTVKRIRRSRTVTTANGKFMESMAMFLSEVSKSMVSACVEQTFTQLFQKGILLAPYAYCPSVDNVSVSSCNHSSADASSISDPTYSVLQPQVDTLVSVNHLFSALPQNDYCSGSVQQHTSEHADVFPLQSHILSTQHFSQSSDFLDAHVEGLVASDTAAACCETALLCEYNSFSACSNTVDTATYATYQSVAQPVQSSNLTDYSLIDLLNMSDDAIDVLLSGFVDCFSDNQLPFAAACSAANSNDVFMSVDTTDVPVCCSNVTSVTEAYGCCPLLLMTVESKNMDYPAELYNENFDSIGEESFQPDYYELDDDGDCTSVASFGSSSFGAQAAGECMTGKKITIRKPGTEKPPVSTTSRQKRPWRSSSRKETASSISSGSSAVETAVVNSSLEETSNRPAEAQVESQTFDPASLIADEVLEGDG